MPYPSASEVMIHEEVLYQVYVPLHLPCFRSIHCRCCCISGFAVVVDASACGAGQDAACSISTARSRRSSCSSFVFPVEARARTRLYAQW